MKKKLVAIFVACVMTFSFSAVVLASGADTPNSFAPCMDGGGGGQGGSAGGWGWDRWNANW